MAEHPNEDTYVMERFKELIQPYNQHGGPEDSEKITLALICVAEELWGIREELANLKNHL